MKKLFILIGLIVSIASLNAQCPVLPNEHGKTDHQPAWTITNNVQEYALSAGFYWWSSYIDLSNNGLSMLQEALGSDANMIKGGNNFTTYTATTDTWSGSLTAINNSSMYLILITSPTSSFSIEGAALNPADVEIPVNSGWNWIGYPSANATNIETALADYAASHNDMIKSHSSFSTYSSESGQWVGSLKTIEPGQGYIILSNSSENKTFHYGNAAKSEKPSSNIQNTVWQVNPNTYAQNMTVIATVKLMDSEVRSNDYELGVFHGDVCHGTTQLMYVEATNSYMAFLTAFGTEGEELQFRLLDQTTGEVYTAEGQNINYSDNAIVGLLDTPCQLEFRNTLSSEETLAGMLNIYPNPMSSSQDLVVTLPETHSQDNINVQVINLLGQVIREESMTGNTCSFNGLKSGVYMVRVLVDNKIIYNNKLIVK